MRAFYVVWFVVCAGFGYSVAGFTDDQSPSWAVVLVSIPAAVALGLVEVWAGLRRLPAGERANSPSLRLKPWDRPTGFLVFLGITFVFSAAWGIAFSAALGMPGIRVAAHILVLGGGPLAAVCIYRYVAPHKFAA